jgi:SAM-dependent methyltransferase
MFEEAAVLIEQMLQDVEFQLILNVGSSTRTFFTSHQPYIWNHILRPLLARGNAVINVDAKPEPGVHLVRSAQDLGLTDFADIVLCCNLLEHVESPMVVLRSIHKALKPGGRLIMEGPAVYPYHADPIDNMLRLKTEEEWDALLCPLFLPDSFQLCKADSRGISALVSYYKP